MLSQWLTDCLSRRGMGTDMKRTLLSLVAVVAAIASPILAQDQSGQQPGPPAGPNDQPQQQEPDGQYEQGRGVARISVLNGEVSVRRGDSGDVVAAAINGPLMANDSILTSSSSRSEEHTSELQSPCN